MIALEDEKVVNLLQKGEITLQGEFMWGSNYTFLAQVALEDEAKLAVYKPSRGERPLWDFPAASLAKREVAAYLVSQALGWRLVPPTVHRIHGPLGPGSLQLFIEHDPQYHYFNFSPDDLQRLRPVVVFDLLINNGDRKGSHILRDPQNHLWLIDHGVCFHVDEKMRTVIWDFVGEPIPDELCIDVVRFRQLLTPVDGEISPIAEDLLTFINAKEVKALARRANALVENPRFPNPDPRRRPFPWPEI